MLAQATKTQAKGFTLVELIVVITILAILATVGFLSLQGYTGDAKNTKTTANLRSVASSLSNEAAISQLSVMDYVSGSTATGYSLNVAGVTATVYSGSNLVLTGGTNYKAGEIDYTKLRIDGSKFFDTNTTTNALKPFALGAASVSETSGSSTRSRSIFQLAGTINNAGTETAIVQGNYSPAVKGTDLAGLIKGNTNCTLPPTTASVKLYSTGSDTSVVVDNGVCIPYTLK